MGKGQPPKALPRVWACVKTNWKMNYSSQLRISFRVTREKGLLILLSAVGAHKNALMFIYLIAWAKPTKIPGGVELEKLDFNSLKPAHYE